MTRIRFTGLRIEQQQVTAADRSRDFLRAELMFELEHDATVHAGCVATINQPVGSDFDDLAIELVQVEYASAPVRLMHDAISELAESFYRASVGPTGQLIGPNGRVIRIANFGRLTIGDQTLPAQTEWIHVPVIGDATAW